LTAYRVPVTYNLQVTREVLRQVYVAERLQIPHWTTFVSEYGLLWTRARNPAFLRELIRSGGWSKVGIYAVEGYGIFKVRSLNFFVWANRALTSVYFEDWGDNRA
jgi:F-type H+-transporting ATPase subunit g